MKTSRLPALLALLAFARLTGHAEDAIHSVAYSHGDLGYATYPHVLRTENRLENLYRAIRYCDETAAWDSHSQYRWQQEMAEPLPLFLGTCTPEQRGKLAKYITEGRIDVAASHCTALADRFKLPIHAIGVGEAADDLRPFSAEDFAATLLGIRE